MSWTSGQTNVVKTNALKIAWDIQKRKHYIILFLLFRFTILDDMDVCDNCGLEWFAAGTGHVVMDGPVSDLWCQACFDKYVPIAHENILRSDTVCPSDCTRIFVSVYDSHGTELRDAYELDSGPARAPPRDYGSGVRMSYCGHVGTTGDEDRPCWECRCRVDAGLAYNE